VSSTGQAGGLQISHLIRAKKKCYYEGIAIGRYSLLFFKYLHPEELNSQHYMSTAQEKYRNTVLSVKLGGAYISYSR
jgi:hypothetical protein